MQKLDLKKGISKNSSLLSLVIAYIIMLIVFSLISPYFMTIGNVMNIGMNTAINGITATAMTLVIILGGLDVSVGSVMAITNMAVSVLSVQMGFGIELIFIALGIGLACGAINGLLITKVGVNPLITTLGTMSIFRGIAYLITDGKSAILKNEPITVLGRGYIFDVIPVALVIMVVIFIIFGFILKRTTFGRKIYTIGGNPLASHLSGINVNRVRFIAYALCGMMAAVSGLILTCQTGSGVPHNAGENNLDIIAAVILGGTSLAGGKGGMVGTLIGVLILSTIANGMTIANMSSYWQLVIKGLVLITAVVIDALKTKEFA